MPRPAFALPVLAASLGPFLLCCTTPVGVERADPRDAYRQLTANALTTGAPSAFSVDVLRRFALAEQFEDDAHGTIETLAEVARHAVDRDVWFALAELSHVAGADADDGGHEEFLAAAIYAWCYLFDPDLEGRPDEYDPRFRLACDLYNRSLALALDRDEDGEVELEAGARAFSGGTIDLALDRSFVTFDVREYQHLLPSWNYEIVGLANRHRTPGLGLSLIAARDESESDNPPRDYLERPPCVVATCLLVIDGGVDAVKRGTVRGTLRLVSPIRVPEIEVEGRRIAVEWDYSAVLAYGLNESILFDLELPALFGMENLVDYTGLYQAQPYEKGKIPVVFIHGTASSVARWADMFNDLLADPFIRQHFQFWYFTYLSGNPIPISASRLRTAIRDARARLDPNGEDPALDQMVLIGHSQGGLLARLAVVRDEQGALWNSVFKKPITEISGDPDALNVVQDAFFPSALESVTRAIYIATPHRGSYLADRLIGRVLRDLISVPDTVILTAFDLVTLNNDILRYQSDERVPTSISGMSTKDPFLLSLSELRPGSSVREHTIVALRPGATEDDGSDGVVEFKSAALRPVESEHRVSAYHSCQGHPLVINEVRRLLRQHAQQSGVIAPKLADPAAAGATDAK